MNGEPRRRLWLEELEKRILLSSGWQGAGPIAVPVPAINFDSTSGSLAILAGAAGASAQLCVNADGGVTVAVNDQVFSNDTTAANFDPALAGVSAVSLRQVHLSGGASSDALTLDNVSADSDLSVGADGTISVTGNLNVTGDLTLAAASLDIDGAVHTAAATLNCAGLLNVESCGSVAVQEGSNGGSITATADSFVNVGQVLADGWRGGQVTITAPDYLNAGVVSAAGTDGVGGSVQIGFSQSYIDTTAALTAASGTGAAGGQVRINGGSGGRLFSSGRFDATGTMGGTIDLFGQNVFLIAATLDASGSAGNGGRVSVWSDSSTDFTGSVWARGNGGAGGYIEVSSHGKLTYSGQSDAGSGGTLLLDPQNLVISDAQAANFPQFSLVPPTGSVYFGAQVVPLATGNLVVTDITGNGGAAYLFNGRTGALISALTGLASDGVSATVTALTNGNYVVDSPYWNGGMGAVTWGSGTTGVSGTVSSANSLVGSGVTDHVGGLTGAGGGVTVLVNGNYVVDSPNWGSDGSSDGKGAVTWGDGASGTSGVVSSENSLVGSSVHDLVGIGSGGIGVTALSNGNYVVDSPDWNGEVGAATWGNGAVGTSGVVSINNSLIGDAAGDYVGFGNVTALANGNYVVDSSQWNGQEGAVTWGNGMTGISGAVSPNNSLVGSNAAAQAGGQPDIVGEGGVTALTNGNYVVDSPQWSLDAFTGSEIGAVTWGNGTTGITGAVSTANSLVGSNMDDQIGSTDNQVIGVVPGTGVTALANGNYVVNSPDWGITPSENAGGADPLGAVTWENGTMLATGTVTAANSLVGYNPGADVGGGGQAGAGGVTALTNGNYVVDSPGWGNSLADPYSGLGAVTWCNGRATTAIVIAADNSLVGSNPGDQIGGGTTTPSNGVAYGLGGGVTALATGNYVISSPGWDGLRGAVTWGNGTAVISGTITSDNSLIGSLPGDQVGGGIGLVDSGTFGAVAYVGLTALSNGNYVVLSPAWNDGQGAATWGNGGAGVHGTISSANSLVNFVGGPAAAGAVVEVGALPNGNYVVMCNTNGTAANPRTIADTWVNGLTGMTLDGQNTIDSENTLMGVFGALPLNGGSEFVATNVGGDKVTVGFTDPNQYTFPFAQDQTLTVTPQFITNTLDAGTNVTLQANDDITISSPITETPGGTAGSLTLQAGRSILLNASINTAGGNLTLIANDTVADGVVNSERDPGNATITTATGVTLNTGSGELSMDLKNSTDKTNNGAGTVTLLGVSAASTTLSSASTLGSTINGLNSGDGAGGTYTQVNVTGPINLDGAMLSIACNATIPTGSTLVIVQASGGISGTFNGLGEGATIVASDGTKFTISYQGGGGHEVTLTASASSGQTPAITPSSASLAANAGSIAIDGSGFSTTPSLDIVTFSGGVKGIVTRATATQLTVTKLTGLKLGTLDATVKVGGVSSGAAVQVATVVPVVAASTASLPANATALVLRGVGFSTTRSNDIVSFSNGASGVVTTAYATELIVTKLTGLTAGPLTASVIVAGLGSGSPVQVATIRPVVSLGVGALPVNGNSLIIRGLGFSTSPGNNVVTFGGGVTGTVTSATATELTVSNLSGLVIGKLTASVITNGVGNRAPVQVATVTPVVTGSTANLAANATSLTIDGFGFSGTARDDVVIFSGGIKGIVTSATATQLTIGHLTGLTAGALAAVVKVFGVSSGALLLVATVTPVVMASDVNLSPTATVLVIRGVGFSTTPGHDTVTFLDGATGTVTTATGTKLIVTKLKGLTAGVLQAIVTSNNESSTAEDVATVT
jgi:hypothetical protein